MTLKKKDLKTIAENIECEGFDYAMIYTSDYTEIEDSTFHQLREDYLNAREALAQYVDADI